MIITLNGDHGSGKSTIAKKLAEELGYERVYMGQIFRDLAEQKGVTLVNYLKMGETDPSIDREADERMVELSRKNKNLVIESRTAWHFIPESLKIYLKVDEEVGAERMFKHLQGESNRSNEDNNINSVDDIVESSRRRKATDNKRYQMYYNIDVYDPKNYDLVFDTTKLGIEDVFQKVLEFVKSHVGK